MASVYDKEPGGFLAATAGLCFLCETVLAKKHFTHDLGKTSGCKIGSFQYIFRYVGLKLKNVLEGAEVLANELIKKKLECSIENLKVPLCQPCADLVQAFSDLYKILENVQMELDSCLGEVNRKLGKDDLKGPREGSMAQIIRTGLKKKCLAKLEQVMPRVKVIRLKENHAKAKESVIQITKVFSETIKIPENVVIKMEDPTSSFPVVDSQLPVSSHLIKREPEENPEFRSNNDDNADPNIEPDKSPATSGMEIEIGPVKLERVETPKDPPPPERKKRGPYKKKPKQPRPRPKYGKRRNEVSCANCGKIFSDPWNLRRHQVSIHNSAPPRDWENPASCSLCHKVLGNKYALQRHINLSHKRMKPFQCSEPGCGKRFPCSSTLKVHREREHQGVTYPCLPDCGNVYRHRTTLRLHQRKCKVLHPELRQPSRLQPFKLCQETEKWKCVTCGKLFSSRETAAEHHQKVHLGIRFECEHCGNFYATKACVTKHARSCPKNPNRISQEKTCGTCGKTYKTRGILRKHVQSVPLGILKHGCETCGRKFRERYNLEDHVRISHKGEKFKCVEPCGRKYDSKPGLTKHQKSCLAFQDSLEGS